MGAKTTDNSNIQPGLSSLDKIIPKVSSSSNALWFLYPHLSPLANHFTHQLDYLFYLSWSNIRSKILRKARVLSLS